MFTKECYSAIKRNSFKSVLVRRMKLETVIQSTVSQKEKNKFCILMHIYGIQKMVLMNLFAGQEYRHGYIQRMDFGHSGEVEGGMN